MTARATRIAAADGVATDFVELDFGDRTRRRGVVDTVNGHSVLLDFAASIHLRDGDVLVLDDGRRVAVRAKPEALIVVRPNDIAHLVRIAWHLGNRHLPVEIRQDAVVLREDHVIADMLRKLGAVVESISAPFDPEGGAYGVGATMGHAHTHGPGDHHHG